MGKNEKCVTYSNYLVEFTSFWGKNESKNLNILVWLPRNKVGGRKKNTLLSDHISAVYS